LPCTCLDELGDGVGGNCCVAFNAHIDNVGVGSGRRRLVVPRVSWRGELVNLCRQRFGCHHSDSRADAENDGTNYKKRPPPVSSLMAGNTRATGVVDDTIHRQSFPLISCCGSLRRVGEEMLKSDRVFD